MSIVVFTFGCGGRAIDGYGDLLPPTEAGLPWPGARGGGGATGNRESDPRAPTGAAAGGGRVGAGASTAGRGVGAPGADQSPTGMGEVAVGEVEVPETVEPERDCPLAPMRLAETADALLDAAAAEVASDRPFIRYVSAGSFRTTCSSPATRDIARARAAVNKLVNSLSSASIPVPARSLDADELLFRLDLRDYGWDRPLSVSGVTHSDAWEAIVAQSGLGLELSGGSVDDLKEQLGTSIPWMLVGSFVAAASQGELYYALTAAPSTLGELKAGLGISPANDLPGGIWQRAGFGNSGISRQDRGVARYAGDGLGARLFWQTFDYSPTTELSGVFLEPLATRADATEVLYSLPNGLPAYFVADGAGRRVVESPFMIDPAQPDGVARVLHSCASCHNPGLIAFQDTVRPFVETNIGGSFTTAEVEAVRLAYPSPSVMDARREEDSRRLTLALVQAGQPEQSPDPLSRVVLDYQLVVDRSTVAGELYVSPDALDLEQLPVALRAADIERGLTRAAFEASYHEAMCSLHAAPIVPVDCP